MESFPLGKLAGLHMGALGSWVLLNNLPADGREEGGETRNRHTPPCDYTPPGIVIGGWGCHLLGCGPGARRGRQGRWE